MSQQTLVQHLKKCGILKSSRVIEAMLETDRRHYCPQYPYEDSPQPIGSQATISAPHMHAHCLELLAPKLIPGANILDVGSGSGYLTACMARMIRGTQQQPGMSPGKVVGIDHIPSLVNMSRRNVDRDDPGLLESGLLMLEVADGRAGYPEEAPYDVIHVGAASTEFPTQLLSQLKVEGILVIPEGAQGEHQELVMYKKDLNGKVSRAALFGVRYVPLTDANTQLGKQVV